jgi:hypothetical protein
MSPGQGFSTDEGRQIGEEIGTDGGEASFDVEQFRRGMDVEREHGGTSVIAPRD